MEELAGRSVLVTGGARRLGRAIALALARQGLNVAVHYHRSKSEAEGLCNELAGLDVRPSCHPADLLDRIATETMFDCASEVHGGIDFLVNSASVFPTDRLATIDEPELFLNLRVNALAPLWLSRRFAAQNRPGAIVNLLDTKMIAYDQEHTAYHLSKRALFSLTRMMAVEFAPTVRVNGVAPGLVLPPEGKDAEYLEALAPELPLARHGNASDVTEAVLYLLSASFVTGQIIFVDGGRHLEGNFYA